MKIKIFVSLLLSLVSFSLFASDDDLNRVVIDSGFSNHLLVADDILNDLGEFSDPVITGDEPIIDEPIVEGKIVIEDLAVSPLPSLVVDDERERLENLRAKDNERLAILERENEGLRSKVAGLDSQIKRNIEESEIKIRDAAAQSELRLAERKAALAEKAHQRAEQRAIRRADRLAAKADRDEKKRLAKLSRANAKKSKSNKLKVATKPESSSKDEAVLLAQAEANAEKKLLKKISKKKRSRWADEPINAFDAIKHYFTLQRFELLEGPLDLDDIPRYQRPYNDRDIFALLKVSEENVIKDKATGTVVVDLSLNKGGINIGEIFVSSDYGNPLVAKIPIKHDPSKELIINDFATDAGFLQGALIQSKPTSYGSLMLINGVIDVNYSFAVELAVSYDPSISGASSIKQLNVKPNQPNR